jgi:hypothetical protein
MRVTIDHHDKYQYEKQGFFRTKLVTVPGHWVRVLIELSDDEKETVVNQNISDYSIHSLPNPEYPKFIQSMNAHYAKYGDTPKEREIGPSLENAPPQTLHIYIRSLVDPKGYWRNFDNLSDAKNWAAELRPIVQKLKGVIDQVSTPGPAETFEL